MWAGGYQSRPKSEATEILTNSLILPAGRIRFQPPDGIGRPNPKKKGGDIQATTKVVDCRSLKSSPPRITA
jgi:hypothetical protein